jgi:hypothetical protein
MITLTYEYEGIKITHELPDHMDLTELLENFSNFIKAMGYQPPEGDLEFVDYDNTTVDDLYAEGYKDAMDVAKREMENGTFNTDNFVGTGDGLELDDCDMLDGIKARAYRCEQERSELRTLPSDDTDSEICCEAPQITTRYDADLAHGTITECLNCNTLSLISDEEV